MNSSDALVVILASAGAARRPALSVVSLFVAIAVALRGFRRAFGFTPHQYLTHLRLQRARDLLRRGHNCGETAHAVGFYDQSQLNRHFVRHLGVTPGAYARAVT
jgi:methylphosphotriester-DNA--protein-cysteine methyltransferase